MKTEMFQLSSQSANITCKNNYQNRLDFTFHPKRKPLFRIALNIQHKIYHFASLSWSIPMNLIYAKREFQQGII